MSKFIPNSFQVPNALIDEMLDKISGNACKVYLLIVRKTRGWNKQTDRISYSQIQKLTGIGSSATVDKAISELVDLNLISYRKGNEKSANEYRLNDEFCTSKNEVGGTSKNEVATSKNEVGGTSKNEDTEIQDIKYTNQKNKGEYDTHTHKSQIDENRQSSKKPKTTAKTSSAKKSSDNKLTADYVMKLKLSDFNFSNDDFKNIPNLGDWLFDNLDYQVVSDYISTRKNKLTMTALKAIVKQSALANITLNQALEFTCEMGWQSFKADWYFNRQQPMNRPNQPSNNYQDELRKMSQNYQNFGFNQGANP